MARKALADGIVTDEEAAHLEALRVQFGMTEEQVEAIARQVREENAKKGAGLAPA